MSKEFEFDDMELTHLSFDIQVNFEATSQHSLYMGYMNFMVFGVD